MKNKSIPKSWVENFAVFPGLILKQGCNAGYTGVYAVYILDFLKLHRILPIFKKNYSITTQGYNIYLERIPSDRAYIFWYFYDYTPDLYLFNKTSYNN